MSSSKFLSLVNGVQQLLTAISSSVGAGDASKIVMTDSSGKLDNTLMPVGIGPDTVTIQASETLAAGDFVNIHDDTGARARKADATNTRPAHGFVLAPVASGQNATVYPSGRNTSLAGLTIGSRYYLSDTAAGGATETAPADSGEILQYLGTADSASSLVFEDNGYIAIS